jgi:diguanylate cyclase (GGDEF)-like protein/PAS domain S-box-containing protein
MTGSPPPLAQAEDHRLEDELRRSERRLAEAQRLARLGSWEWDIAADAVLWSDELYRIYGLEPGAIVPSYEEFLARVHPDDRESVDQRNRRAFADHQPFEDVKRVVRPDGSVFLMRTQGEVVVDDDGTPVRMLGVCEDVTAEIRAREAESVLASIVRSSNDAIFSVVPEGEIVTWNPAAERLFGYPAAEAIGSPAAILVPMHVRREDARLLRATLDGEPVDAWETTRVRRDGTEVAVSLLLSALPVRSDGGRAVSVVARDITERKRFEAQLQHLAEHDGLTELCNRRRFDDELLRAVADAGRHGETGALLLLDLDDFKFVNDTFGHGAGDELLRSVAGALQSRVRATDVLARLGGDEFAVLLTRTGTEEARRVAADLLAAVRDHTVIVDRRRVRVTTSIGVVVFDGDSGSKEDVLAAADRAMYQAKDAARDRFTIVAGAPPARTRRHCTWESRIREALERDGLRLHCQPIRDLQRNEVTRYELLLRMLEPDGTLVPPTAFLGVAERLGLIHAIDRWVVAQAIGLAASYRDTTFAVNLSGRSMDDDALLPLIRDELERTGADPHRLVFELTETAAIASMTEAQRFAEELTALGCELAIDDFGAGFGSFFYLKHLPAAYLKIDGDFVRSPRSRTDQLVIEAIVGMARGLGKRTIAEFVGDDATVEMLTAVGVDFGQGYHLGRPFPVEELSSGG